MKFKAQYDLNLTPAEQLKAYGIRKAIRIGSNRAAAKVKAVVVSNAQKIKLTGHTAKSIRIKVKVYANSRYVSIIGPSRKFSRSKGRGTGKRHVPARYALLIEKGTERIKAKPFIKPALEATASQYCADSSREVGIEIAKELDRQAVKAGR